MLDGRSHHRNGRCVGGRRCPTASDPRGLPWAPCWQTGLHFPRRFGACHEQHGVPPLPGLIPACGRRRRWCHGPPPAQLRHWCVVEFHDGRCLCSPVAGGDPAELPFPRSTFRLIPARVAAMCQAQGPAPASPKQGEGTVQTGATLSASSTYPTPTLPTCSVWRFAGKEPTEVSPTEPQKFEGDGQCIAAGLDAIAPCGAVQSSGPHSTGVAQGLMFPEGLALKVKYKRLGEPTRIGLAD